MRFAGSVRGADLAWKEGLAEWVPLSDIIGKTPPPPNSVAEGTLARHPPPLGVPALPPGHSDGLNGPEVLNTPPVSEAGFVKAYLLPDGRLGRSAFVIRTAVLCLAGLLSLLGLLAFPNSNLIAPLFASVLLVCFLIFTVQAAKRLHDFDASAGWIFVMITGLGALVLSLMLVSKPGTATTNRFGNRSPPRRGARIAAWWFAGACMFGMAMLILLPIGLADRTASSRPIDAPASTAKLSSRPNVAPASTAKPSQTIWGTEMQYAITVPEGWKITRKHELTAEQGKDIDLLLTYKALMVGVIAEDADLGDLDVVVRVTQETAKKNLQATLSNVASAVIDGRTWKAFTAEGKNKDVPLKLQYYVYTGPDGSFQLFGGTIRNLFDRDADVVRNVMLSFKFPPTNNAVSPSASASTSPVGHTSSGIPEPPFSTPVTSASPDGRRALPVSEPSVNRERKPMSGPEIARLAFPSVVLIATDDAKGQPLALGSGFFVEPGIIATNLHVIRGAATASAKVVGKTATKAMT